MHKCKEHPNISGGVPMVEVEGENRWYCPLCVELASKDIRPIGWVETDDSTVWPEGADSYEDQYKE